MKLEINVIIQQFYMFNTAQLNDNSCFFVASKSFYMPLYSVHR